MRTFLAVLGVLALLAVACWNGGEEATPTTRGARTVPAAPGEEPADETKTEVAAPKPEYPEITINIGHSGAPDGYADIAAVRFKELVGQRSSGRMSVEVYPSSQMGSERDLVEGAQLGWIDAGVVFAGILGGLLPEVGVVSLPFLFDGQDHVDAVFDGPVGRELLGLAEGVGIKALAIGQYGLRSIMNSWRPIYIPADAADLRFGVPESDIDMRTYELVGANPVPLPGLEIFPSLQNGVVDGTGAPIFAAITQKYYETPMRYRSLTEHIYAALLLFMSGELWDSLGPAAQELVQEAAIEATAPHQSQPIFGAEQDPGGAQALRDARHHQPLHLRLCRCRRGATLANFRGGGHLGCADRRVLHDPPQPAQPISEQEIMGSREGLHAGGGYGSAHPCAQRGGVVHSGYGPFRHHHRAAPGGNSRICTSRQVRWRSAPTTGTR